MDSQKLGKFGEEIACRFLEEKGYKIIEKNYFKIWDSAKKGEIDIIAKKDGVFIFIEVKTQKSPPANSGRGFLPEDRVDFQKQRKLIKLAQTWLIKNKISLDSKWQMDVISAAVDPISEKAEIKHFQNAFC